MDEITKIPWGTQSVVSGQLWFKDETMRETNGAEWFRGRKITFTSSARSPEPATTNEYSNFVSNLKADSTIRRDCILQAHFEGDRLFDKAHSNIIYYDIVKRRTSLNLTLDNLKLSIGDKVPSTTLDAGQHFRIEGRLHDLDSNSPLDGKRITLQTNMISKLLFATTSIDGSFNLSDLRAPSITGEYHIRALFPENDRYYEAKSELIAQVIERDSITTESRPPSGKYFTAPEISLKKVFICYATEDEEKARRLYHDLNNLGKFDVWFDKAKLLPGQNWEIEIEKAIQSTDYIIDVLREFNQKKRIRAARI